MRHRYEGDTYQAYRGTRPEIEALMKWLMDRDYWFTVSATGPHLATGEFLLKCSVDAHQLAYPFRGRPLTKKVKVVDDTVLVLG